MAGVIYEPKGAAREYSELACNLYTGCDHRCGYCYAPGALRMTREAFGSPTPKKTIIERLTKDADRLARQGEQRSILLCFTCDPYQATDEEHRITRSALEILLSRGLKVTILTKGGRRSMRDFDLLARHREQVTYAATLTFTDEADRRTWEPGAAPTEERIAALEEAHGLGIPTWVSLEPVIRPDQSLELIRRTAPFVDLYKVGKWNHAAETAAIDWQRFGSDAIALLEELRKPYYIKDDLRRCLIPAAGGGAGVTDTRTPDREPMTYYKGEMVPRREVERIQAAEATPATTPPPQAPAPMPAAARGEDPAPAPGRSDPYVETFNALQLLVPAGGVFEVRALGDRTASGYFDADHLEQAAKAIEALDAAGTYSGIYVTLNPVNPALLSRRSNRIETRLGLKEATTADADIIRRQWFPVDIDPKRPSGIGSSDAEHAAALEVAGNVAGFLSEFFGFPAPVRGDSGNGGHLLYRIDLPNDDEGRSLIERCLKGLGAAFDRSPTEDRPGVEIDQTPFNAARIWKLYGTVARKGDNTSERPHRRARIIEAPEVIEVVPRETLERLAALAPEEEQPRQAPRPRSSRSSPDLDEWLKEYGASLPPYRAKNKPGFRSFYVFDVCPWDPSHRDRSAFMGQFNHGPQFAGCHHNGCSGNGWAELRALVEPKRPKPTPVRKEPRPLENSPKPAIDTREEVPATWPGGEDSPSICTTGAYIHEMSEGALAVVNRWNSPPELFARSACLVRVALDEKKGLYIQELDEAALTGILDRLIVWYRVLKDGEERPAQPPRDVVRDILALPAAAWRVPHLAGVTATPIFHPDGTIHTTPGYDEETGLYYAPADGFALAPVPEVPTREDVAAALKMIEEVFVDFPFCSPADRANAIGALLTAVLRPCIAGPVPLYLTDKPQAGSGAGLLQRVIGWIAEGREPALKTMPTGPEMRKEIFAGLKNGTRIQIFDNLEDRLSSPELAAALTAVEMTGRILGQTEERTYAVRTFWMANGNNVTVGGDLARRTFKSRVDPQDPMPWQREGFRHPDLLRWVQEARGRILAAVFTLARAWIQAGRPAPEKVPRVGSFEDWRDMIGGILESAGVPDFMGNASEVYLAADEDRVQWENFLQALWKLYGCNPFTTGSVASRMTYPEGIGLLDAMPDDLAEAYHTKNKTFSKTLGQAFKKVDGRHFPGGWCIKQGKLADGIRQWVITYTDPGQVDCKCIVDSGGNRPELEMGGDMPEPGESSVFSVLSPIPYAQEKNTDIKPLLDTVINGSENLCAIAIADNTLNPLHSRLSGDNRPIRKSDGDTGKSTIHLQSTFAPPPPGTLKHPIDRYERRKYDSSIVCMVPGCKRPAAYGCGAGFPLCEGHYLAEVERVRRDGGRPA